MNTPPISPKEFAKRLLISSSPMELIETTAVSLNDMLAHVKHEEQAKLLSFYSFHAYQAGDHQKAHSFAMQAYDKDPQANYIKNAVITARKTKDKKAIDESLTRAISHSAQSNKLTDQAALFDVICHSYGDLKDLKNAALFGTKSLETKHKSVLREPAFFTLAAKPKPAFDYFKPARNVIAFSLFGDQPRYTHFALENVKAAHYIFPGWSCRFYIDDTVPPATMQQLLAHKAQVILRPRHDPKTNSGLFWRFEVASDPNVDYFLVRDADSLLCVKEKLAVDEWVLSQKSFHIMRDYYSHSELILAGLWGGISGVIPNMPALIEAWHQTKRSIILGQANQDQLFLRKIIWPAIHSHVLTHDSLFTFHNPQPFSPLGLMQPVRHIGQDMGIFLKG